MRTTGRSPAAGRLARVLFFAGWATCGRPALADSQTFSQTPLEAIRVDPSTGHFVDEHGRVRVFHGMNAVFKEPPWFPPSDGFSAADSLDGETMDLLREWGFNVVRLGVMWPGVEPAPEQVDVAYLRHVANLSSELARRGVYTLVDLHQDVGSRRFCGEGFPEHYVDALLADPNSSLSKAAPFPWPLPFKLRANVTSGFPLLEDCNQRDFALYYTTEQTGALWKELYTPGSALYQGFLRFWSVVAETFAQGAPHILAYELLNEPSGECLEGTAESCLEHLPVLSNWVEREVLAPLYRAAAAAIRQKDPSRPIFYEATPLPKLGMPVFPEPPLGNDTQQGLSYHIYCAPGDGDSPISALVCRASQDLFTHGYFDWLQSNKGVAGFLTEFGAVGGSPVELDHLDRLLGLVDGTLQSWAYWQLKKFHDFTTANANESMFDPGGNLELGKLRTLSRTYAQAIAGRPISMSFDPSTAAFELRFNATVPSAPTEIYINRRLHYPRGYSLWVEPPGCLRLQSSLGSILQLGLDSPSCLNTLLKVHITSNSTERYASSILV